MPKKVTLLGFCLAAAMLLSYIESLIPPLVSIPGIKVGLANIIIIFALCQLGIKEAALVSAARIVLCALLFGNFISFSYSLCGALLSLTLMALLKKLDLFSLVGISVVGGVMHNVGQIIAAIFILGTKAILGYLPVLIISGTLTGAIIGIISALVIKRFSKIRIR